jgi:hypothetical protein
MAIEGVQEAWCWQRLTARDSGLEIQMPGRADVVLQPIFPDAFAGEVVTVVKSNKARVEQ